MSSFWVHVDEGQIEAIQAQHIASRQQVHIAFNRALRRTMRAIRTKAAKDLRLQLKVPSTIWRSRLKLYVRSMDGTNRLYFGLDPISLARLNPRQTKSGVTAQGRVKRKSAFIANGKNKNRLVFKRRGKARLPLDKQEFEVEEQTLMYIEDELFDEIEPLLYKNFERELAWETHEDNPKNK